MESNMVAAWIKLKEAPIENTGTIGVVECYHAPLRLEFTRIRSELDRTTSDDDWLELDVFSMNTTTGPEEICTGLMVFGPISTPARTTPAPSQMDRENAIEKSRGDL